MIHLERYEVCERLRFADRSQVYAAIRRADGRRVVLKLYPGDRSTDDDCQARRELEILRGLDSPSTPRPLEVQRDGERPVLVLEHLPGLSLAHHLEGGPLALDRFLEVAERVALLLSEVHSARILHGDLRPANLLLERTTGRVSLIDFGSARSIGTAASAVPSTERLDLGDLTFVAPEQTGRMDRGVDLRSDLYSLGVTFYVLLTGRSPFTSGDPRELIHAHIARVPEAIDRIAPAVPRTVARIVAKLLEKSPERRYQSGEGLAHDLRECREQWRANGRIDLDLQLGSHDGTTVLCLADDLHGREHEATRLSDALESLATAGAKLVLVGGPPGVGKSSLAAGLQSEVLQQDGRFVRGQFDAYRRDQPLLGFTTALVSLADQVLTESSEEVERWRSEARQALGGAGRVLIDLVPSLERLLPGLDPVPPVGPEQSQRRLIVALARFIAVFARPGRPLVLVLEDLQWSDAATALLIEELLQGQHERPLLLIATHRCDSGEEGAAVAVLRSRLRQLGRECESVWLGPLDPLSVRGWLAEVLERSQDDVRTLAERVTRTTSGHPLLVKQYLEHLVELGVLRREPGVGWSWCEASLEAAELPDDVATLMTAKIAALSEGPRRLLRVASVAGDEIDLELVGAVAGQDADALAEGIETLRAAGLLRLSPRCLRFAHARIREAAQGLLSSDERAELHLRIGKHLLATTESVALPARVLEIMDHVDHALARIDPSERARMLELNFMAGQTALVRGSPALAERYLGCARQLFEPGDWEMLPDLSVSLYFASAETAYTQGHHDHALELLEVLEQRPLDPIGLARIYGRRVSICVLREGIEPAVRVGLEGLARLGRRLVPRPGRFALHRAVARCAWELFWAHRQGRLHPRLPKDPIYLAQALLFSSISGSLYRYDMALFAQLVAAILEMQRRHGLPSVAISLFSFAHVQTLVTGQYKLAQTIGDLAKRVASQEPTYHLGALLLINEHLLVAPWVRHRRASLEPLLKAVRLAEEIGEVEHTIYASFYHALLLYLVGEPLPIVLEAVEQWNERSVRLTGKTTAEPMLAILAALRDPSEVDERAIEAALEDPDGVITPIVATLWVGALYVLGQPARALELAERMGPLVASRAGTVPHVPDLWLMHGLSAAALLDAARRSSPSVAPSGVRAWRKSARGCLRRLQRLARQGPENFAHQAQLLEACLDAALGRSERALSGLRRATERAHAQGYHQHAAMACERRALLCLDEDLPREAAFELARALALYSEWGAHRKVELLQREHRELLEDHPLPAVLTAPGAGSLHAMQGRASADGSQTLSPHGDQSIELSALLRAAEALSSELVLERVLDRVMALAIETAGAERAVLLLEDRDGLHFEAERRSDGDTERYVDRPSAQDRPDQVPLSVVQYVARSRKTTVVGHASKDSLFQQDPYVCARESRSILCIPILRQALLVGVLYFENDLTANAFTKKSIDVLGLLSIHAAISLHNARLYKELRTLNVDLEERVEVRTRELRSARDAAQAADRAKSEFLAVMSHEIRTPMNVVLGMSELLEDTPLLDDQRECVTAVRTAGSSLLTLINDILDFSKIEAGKLELESIPFDLRDCVEDVVEILAPKALEKGLHLPACVSHELPATLLGDPVRLKQAMINFVGNALKFTDSGEVGILAHRRGDHLRVEVRDTGIGIPPDRMDRLFQSFSQVDVSTTRRYGGTGLGLAISRGLIEAMQGRVGAESELGSGSTFFFEIPLGPASDSAARSRPLDGYAIAVAMSHEPSARGLAEQIRFLGGRADLFDSLAAARHCVAARPPDRGLLLLRHPLDRPEWAAEVARLSPEERARLVLLTSIQQRPQAARECGPDVRTLTWPVRLSALRRMGPESRSGQAARTHAGPNDREPSRAATGDGRIIVAEDYALNQKLIERLLDRFGYACEIVENGRLLVEATSAGTYDLALVDCQMPLLDGFGATREIREREAHTGEHLPIIAMTANAMKGDRERCLEAGMDDYISKPLHVEALRALLGKYLD